MAADSTSGSPSLWVPNLAVLLLLAVGLLNEKIPLVSGRPPSASADLQLGETPARLWEDPLAIKAPTGLKVSGVAPLRAFFSEAVAENKPAGQPPPVAAGQPPRPRILVLPVLLPGAPYAEATENRLRIRYAVLSALGRAQYVPEEADRMKFIHVGLPEGAEETVRLQKFHVRYLVTDNVHMPGNKNYEEYPLDGDKWLKIPAAYDSVIVLWLNEDHLRLNLTPGANRAEPLVKNLDRLMRRLLDREAGTPDTPAWDLKFIGPNSSDELAAMLQPELKEFKPFHPAEFLSPRATAANTVLQISAKGEAGFDQINLGHVGGAEPDRGTPDWKIRRTIATDEQLASALLDELKRRKVYPEEGRPMVLVGEWDTLYSRGLGRTMAALLTKASREKPTRAAWAVTPGFLREISYLRGLDGELADAKPDDANQEKPDDKPKKSSLELSTGDPDRVAGRSQFDYLRRLAGQLQQLQDELGANSGIQRHEIGSIGVVGSDTYDKLLVLRALRKCFPHTLFFTTDLDAAYLERTELDHTRNLIVASSYGLSAEGALQGRIPPFRDNYQTAMFVSVLQALGAIGPASARGQGVVPPKITPRVFEIGRNSYTELATPARPDITEGVPRGTWVRSLTQPSRLLLGLALVAAGLGLAFWYWLGQMELGNVVCPAVHFAALCSLLGVFIIFCSHHLSEPASASQMPVLLLSFVILVVSLCFFCTDCAGFFAQPRGTAAFVAIVLLFTGALGWLTVLNPIAGNPEEEPFAWFQGRSIWPTEIVRLFAILLSLSFILRCEGCLRKLVVDLNIGSRRLAGKGLLWRLWPLNFIKRKETDRPVRESTLKVGFCQTLAPRDRAVRIFIWIIVYLLVFFPLMMALGFPAVPARGIHSFALDQGILYASVFVYCYLLFMVIDATVLCAVFVNRLSLCIGKVTELTDNSTIYLINDLTEEVAGLVYLPFTVLFIMVAARNSLFDNWDWPADLVAVLGSGLVLLFFASATLQHYSQKAKGLAVEAASKKLLDCLEAPHSDHQIAWLKEQREQIRAFYGVVFRPWYHNPIYRAILIPLGGIGSLQVMEQMSNFF